jgi:hypothetical protein
MVMAIMLAAFFGQHGEPSSIGTCGLVMSTYYLLGMYGPCQIDGGRLRRVNVLAIIVEVGDRRLLLVRCAMLVLL